MRWSFYSYLRYDVMQRYNLFISLQFTFNISIVAKDWYRNYNDTIWVATIICVTSPKNQSHPKQN
jgi:hypothetical protein